MEIIQQELLSKQTGPGEEVIQLYNEGYYTDDINSDSLNQESDHKDNNDDDTECEMFENATHYERDDYFHK